MVIQWIAAKKAELDRLRPRVPHGLDNLNRSHDFELTYTSNAIEGNTLTAVETRMVIEHGITIGGKPLKDHLETVDHFEALRFVRDLARQRVPFGGNRYSQSASPRDAALRPGCGRPLR